MVLLATPLQIIFLHHAFSSIVIIVLQNNQALGLGTVWHSQLGGVALGRGDYLRRCQDSDPSVNRRGQGQVPAGGSHHGTVPAPQCGEAVWSGHCGRTSELGIENLTMLLGKHHNVTIIVLFNTSVVQTP